MNRRAMIENMNYYSDGRVQAGMRGDWFHTIDEKRMVAIVMVERDITRKQAEELGLPSPEEVIGPEPDWYDPEGEMHYGSGTKKRGPYTPENLLGAGTNDEGVQLYGYEEVPVEVLMAWEVCPTCDGKGSHVNPSIDCGGLTAEDFDEDPDFRESYMSGTYDQPCNECSGRRVIPEMNRECNDPEVVKLVEDRIRDAYDDAATRAAELRMGC